jgi:hypothetical protein
MAEAQEEEVAELVAADEEPVEPGAPVGLVEARTLVSS